MDAFAAMLKAHSAAGEFGGEDTQDTIQIPVSGQSTETLEVPLLSNTPSRFKAAWQQNQSEQMLRGPSAPVAEEQAEPFAKKQKLLGDLASAPITPKLVPKAKWIPHVAASCGSASSGADSVNDAEISSNAADKGSNNEEQDPTLAMDWNNPAVLATERQVAFDLNVPWQQRGPPGPHEGGPVLWRNQKYREQSGKWSTRGGKHKDYWNEIHRRMNLTGETMQLVKAQVLSEKAKSGGKSSSSKSE
jgi:hypothetical protein